MVYVAERRNMLATFKTMFFGVMNFLKYPIIIIIALYCIFFGIYGIFHIIEYSKGRRPAPTSVKKVKRPNLLYSIFFLVPRQMVEDYLNRPADYFDPHGVVVFTGEQGAGKTVGLVEYTLHLQACYPKSRCLTNFDYQYENDELTHWKQLTHYKNGYKGVIVGIDEMQNWFSSMQSKNFPPEMLSVVTQNRKNRRIILGTAQNFHMLAKSIRTQTTEVRECATYFNCFTIVRCRKPILDETGTVVDWKERGYYFFVQTPRIRDSYDTYKVIENLADAGFIDRQPPIVEA